MNTRESLQTDKQQGAILFISLIILLLITMVAISSTRLSTMGQRVSMTYQMQNTIFQGADSALDHTQRLLNTSPHALNLAYRGALSQKFSYPDTTTGLTVNAESTTVLAERIIDNSSSLGVGKGLPQVQIYTINSNASIDGYTIETQLQQGYQIRTLGQ